MYRHNYAAEGLQESFPAAQTFSGVPFTVATTGPSLNCNQSPAYNSQYLVRTAADVTPTKGPVYRMNCVPPQQHMNAFQQLTHTPPLQSTPACMYPQEQVFGPPIRFESPATSLLSPYSEEYYGHNVPQPTVNPTLPEPGKPCAVTSTQPTRSTESKAVDPKISFGSQFTGEPAKVPNFGGVAAVPTTTATTAFKFHPDFKSNDGDFTFSAQVKNSESLLGLLTSDIPPKAEVPSEPKHQTQDQLPSQSEVFTVGSKTSAGFSVTDGAQNKMSVFGDTGQRFTSGTKPTLGNSESREEKSVESDNDSTHVEEDEDGPHFEPIVPLPDKVDVKTGEEEEEEMFCKRAKLFRFDSETKEWKERGIGSIKILKHKTSGKVRLVMRREQVLKICANHYINVDMALKPNAGSDKSWVWYAMDYADEMPKTEQLAIRFKTADEAELFKVKFEESQKFISESPQDQQTEKKSENPQPQVSSKEVDLKTLFSKKEGEWDCDVCCVRNTHTSAVCVACNNAAPSTAQVKPVEEPKGSGPVAPPAKQFSFGLSGDSAKNTSSTDVSSKGFMFGSQIPVSFKFGSKDAVVTSAGFGAQAEKKTIQADAPQQEKASAAPAVPFGTGFAQFAKKEGQWDCVSCLVRNDASATECVSCKAPCNTEKRKAASQGELAAMCGKNDEQWDCGTCLVRNEGSCSHCVSCQTANPNMKNKISDASSQPAKTGFNANFNPGPAFQFGTSKDKVSSEGFRFESSTTEAEKSSGSSSFSFSMSAPVGGFQFGIAESEAKPSDGQSQNGSASDILKNIAELHKEKEKEAAPSSSGKKLFAEAEAKPSDGQSQNGSASDLLKNIAELHKEKEKEAAPSSSDQSVDADSPDNYPLITGKPNTLSFADLAKSQVRFQKDPTFKGFEGAGKKPFTEFHSGTKADISGDQDDKMYKTEENDNIQCEPEPAPMSDFAEVSTGEESKQDLSSHQSKLCCDDKELCQTPEANLGAQSTKNLVSLPKCDFESDSVQDFNAANFNPGPAFQFGTSKDKVSSEGFRFESSTTEAEKSSDSSSFLFSMSAPVGRFQFGIAEAEAKPSDGQSQNGPDLFKNISELHKEKEKEAAPSSSDQFVDADSHDNNPLFTGKPNTLSFADLAKSQGSFQKDPTFKGFAGAGEQLFTGFHSSTKADISGDQDEKMYKTEENDNSRFEPVPLPDFVEVSTGEENKQDLFSHQSKLSCDDKDLCQTPGAKLGIQNTNNLVSPPKCDFESDSEQKNFGSPSPSKEKCPVIISSSKDEETAVSRLKTSGPAVSSQSSVGTPFSIPTRNEEQRARHLLLPPTFLCGISSDSEAEAEKPDDFNTELQKLQPAQVTCASDLHIAASPVCSTAPVLQVKPSHDAAAVDTSGSGAEERQTDTSAADGIDLSAKRSSESDSSTATGLSFGFASAGGFSFTELAKTSGVLAFGKKDDHFSWPDTGATIFGSPASQTEREETSPEAEAEDSLST